VRTLLVLLLLANLTLLGYTLLDRRTVGEGARLQEQVRPDKIKLLSPGEVAKLGPAKVASLPDVCVEWGPFTDAERARALADLEPLALGKLLTQRRVRARRRSGSTCRRRTGLRRDAGGGAAGGGHQDLFVVDSAAAAAISLGLFRTEEAAAHLAELASGTWPTRGSDRGSRRRHAAGDRDPRDPVMNCCASWRLYPGAETRSAAAKSGLTRWHRAPVSACPPCRIRREQRPAARAEARTG
jgi:hypothetical protein